MATLYILLQGEERTENNLFHIARCISGILDKGFMFTELRRIIYISWLKNYHGILDNQSSNLNLLKTDIYYHKNLRVQAEPYTVDLDYNTGEMVSHSQEYFVEMVASYSLDDLREYIYSLGIVDEASYDKNRINGLIKFYLKKYNLETVLFMIDAAYDSLEDFNNKILFEKLDSYYPKAMAYYQNIKNNCSSNGGNVICPKKRF